jgi:RimJ/RimL family protein N-acetyltransferase
LIGRRGLPWGFPDVAPLSKQQVEAVVQRWAQAEKSLPLAIVRSDGGELIGHAECDWGWDPHQPSVGVVIAPAYQRQHYGSEALRLLLRYLFHYTPAHCITCWIPAWNEAGLRFAAHHGFQVGGRMRRAGIYQGQYYDLIISDLLRPEWLDLEGGPDAA